MRLLSSTALWWLLLGAIIVFFYLLKLKRKRTIVPSVLLWKRALDEVEANAPFKRLRRSLLLLLQLLVLVALVFALARPLVITRALASGSTVIIIDSTASMSARDEDGGSRLDKAKSLAREMIGGLGAADRAAIIESSSRVTVRSPLTSDRAALTSAIGEIHETDAPGVLTDALRLSEQIARSEADTGIVVISDGGSTASTTAETPLEASRRAALAAHQPAVRFVRVGKRADNVGIIAMNSRRISEVGRRELFASIANFGEQPRTFALELRIDGRLIDARTIQLDPADRRPLVFDSLPQGGGLAELKLDLQDDLISDNTAFAFLPDAHRVRVGVRGENPFLLEALASNPEFEARKITAPVNSLTSGVDCFVSEGANAIEDTGSVLLINPPDIAGLVRVTGERERPEITTVDLSSPINSFLSYSDLHIETMARREVASWLKPIVIAGSDPLIWAGNDGRRRIVLVGFDLARSDLPLKVEFPILLANSIAWLSGTDSPAQEHSIRSGQPATIQTSASSVTVTLPGGETEEIPARGGSAVFADTLQAGRYDVKGGTAFTASLLTEGESNTAPRDAISTLAGEVNGQRETLYSEREMWRWTALLALVVLMIEWWAYHRRIS